MYAVVVRGQAQDGKMEDLKNFIKNEAIPSLEVEGMISIGFCNPEENVNLGMVFLADKEASDRFGGYDTVDLKLFSTVSNRLKGLLIAISNK